MDMTAIPLNDDVYPEAAEMCFTWSVIDEYCLHKVMLLGCSLI